MTKYLILNADDFGLSPSVNRGVIESYKRLSEKGSRTLLHVAVSAGKNAPSRTENVRSVRIFVRFLAPCGILPCPFSDTHYKTGTIFSATLMTNMPGFEDAVRIAKEEPGLGAGLHFNLSYGKPLSDPATVPSLVDETGRYTYHPDDTTVTWTADDVRRELQAQWDKFTATGLRPTHIDSHHLIHALEPAYAVVAEFCHAMKVPLRKTEPLPRTDVVHPKTTDKLVVDDYFHGDGKERLLKHIAAVQDGVTEIISHPGYVRPSRSRHLTLDGRPRS